VDASNITLTWDRPPGRIEAYDVTWTAIDPIPDKPPDDSDGGDESENLEELSEDTKRRSELLSGEKIFTQHVWDDTVRIPILPLMSGVAYAIEVGTTSYGMKGDRYNVTIRTCTFIILKCMVVLQY
jgi:hypothetical protein